MTNGVPQHPGIELKKLISEKGMNLSQFARNINVSSSRISEIVSGKRSITIDSSIKIANYFDMKPEYWLIKQNKYDLCCKRNIIKNISF